MSTVDRESKQKTKDERMGVVIWGGIYLIAAGIMGLAAYFTATHITPELRQLMPPYGPEIQAGIFGLMAVVFLVGAVNEARKIIKGYLT